MEEVSNPHETSNLSHSDASSSTIPGKITVEEQMKNSNSVNTFLTSESVTQNGKYTSRQTSSNSETFVGKNLTTSALTFINDRSSVVGEQNTELNSARVEETSISHHDSNVFQAESSVKFFSERTSGKDSLKSSIFKHMFQTSASISHGGNESSSATIEKTSSVFDNSFLHPSEITSGFETSVEESLESSYSTNKLISTSEPIFHRISFPSVLPGGNLSSLPTVARESSSEIKMTSTPVPKPNITQYSTKQPDSYTTGSGSLPCVEISMGKHKTSSNSVISFGNSNQIVYGQSSEFTPNSSRSVSCGLSTTFVKHHSGTAELFTNEYGSWTAIPASVSSYFTFGNSSLADHAIFTSFNASHNGSLLQNGSLGEISVFSSPLAFSSILAVGNISQTSPFQASRSSYFETNSSVWSSIRGLERLSSDSGPYNFVSSSTAASSNHAIIYLSNSIISSERMSSFNRSSFKTFPQLITNGLDLNITAFPMFENSTTNIPGEI